MSKIENKRNPLMRRINRWQSIGIAVGFFTFQIGANDLAPLSDEFGYTGSFQNWEDLGVVEGWGVPSYELAEVNETVPGHLRVVPGPLTWFNHLRGLLLFKAISGDFVATTRVRVLSRHNPEDPTEPPNRSFSLAGLFVHQPRPIVQAAPNPYTTDAIWPPAMFGSDYAPNTENYVFLSFGSAGNPGTRQFEIKSTRDSVSQLYFASTGVPPSDVSAWLQLVRVGNTIVCLRNMDRTPSGLWRIGIPTQITRSLILATRSNWASPPIPIGTPPPPFHLQSKPPSILTTRRHRMGIQI